MGYLTSEGLGKILCQQLGLPRETTYIKIECIMDEAAKIEVECLLPERLVDEEGNFMRVLKRYQLKELEE